MSYDDFIKSLAEEFPTVSMSTQLQALWYEKKGKWSNAHNLVDPSDDPKDKHIHAYLHRKEGDKWNANYWYQRAGKAYPEITLDEEWQLLVKLNTAD
jgi:hypothetical protein